MSAVRNKVQLIGHLETEPQISTTEAGRKKAEFMVATDEFVKNAKGEKVTETQFHKVVAWGKLAEIAEKYLVKGIEVALEGKLVNSGYTDKKGKVRYISDVHANELLILTKRQ
jgi:single-strand DNA-binding protein